ncbi:hypothetical protein ADL22_19580 [Streptomyces sp. NRRL F-4489]|uniref:divalent metal cation transporter n=1 Tax=Streptomyces sp. NRRL F-4489 TaxID=1609095 RepID=UPI0007485439|nr:divalent metal cation transporter [Streptomyces sp. NRRL F-4489]KUL38061.1 hypothetical protein ADL22_19580 [Streptomyces sp. NRRL F-4489]
MTDLTTGPAAARASRSAVLDEAHLGDIQGALGTIKQHDTGERLGLTAKFKTLLAIAGPGLIVMVGDNDAGAFDTYGQAGQNYGTSLLWTLLLLVPVLYVNQEMVLRLGAVTGVGHARLILERFGKFWGAFSVIDLFLLNALTLVTEFIGITLAAGYLGLPKAGAVLLAAAVIIASAFTGSFRRFERVAIALCAGSLLLVPLYFMVHPKTSQMVHDFAVPAIPASVFLLLLCNDRAVLGPWANGPKTNAFTSAVVGVLVTLSVILTASVLFPGISSTAILDIMAGCGVIGILAAGYSFTRRRTGTKEDPIDRTGRDNWRMPPLDTLARPTMSTGRKIGMGALRTYLLVAMVLVIIKIVQVALGQ